MKSLAQYKLTAVITATPATALVGAGRIMAVSLESGSGACSVDIFDDTDAIGTTAIFTMKSGAAVSHFEDLTEMGGIPFATGCWVVPTGTGAICYVWVA
jgi:hypothetical protein